MDDMTDVNLSSNAFISGFHLPKVSPWKCHMFGSTPASQGLCWVPNEGCEPNWFWRKMQWLILGNLWVKDDD